MHIPVNHHLRPVYRAIALLVGAYFVVYGIIGFARTSGQDFFTRDDAEWVLGLRTNAAFAILSIVVGAVLVLANLVGRNVDSTVNMGMSILLGVVGTALLTVMQTDLNVFAFSMVNVIVVYSAAIILGTAGLYGKVGTAEHATTEDALRHGR